MDDIEPPPRQFVVPVSVVTSPRYRTKITDRPCAAVAVELYVSVPLAAAAAAAVAVVDDSIDIEPCTNVPAVVASHCRCYCYY